MDADGRLGFLRSRSEEEELPTGIARDGLNRSNEDPLSEVVLLPVESLVGSVKNVIRRVFVAVKEKKEGRNEGELTSDSKAKKTHSTATRFSYSLGDDENGSVISELPKMSVLVDLLPGESSVSSQEGVRVAVSFEESGRLVSEEIEATT